MSLFGFGKKPVAPAVVPDASTVPSAVPDTSTTVSAAPAAPAIIPAGVILRITDNTNATTDIQFTLDSNNKLTAINNGKFQIATSDGTKPITDSDFALIEIKNGILSKAPILEGAVVLPKLPIDSTSSSSMGPIGPPPGFTATNPVKGGSTRRRAYRPRKGTRRNRITR